MKRKSFLATLAGAVAGVFMPKRVVAIPQDSMLPIKFDLSFQDSELKCALYRLYPDGKIELLETIKYSLAGVLDEKWKELKQRMPEDEDVYISVIEWGTATPCYNDSHVEAN